MRPTYKVQWSEEDIEEQVSPSSTVMKVSGILPMSEYDEVGQQVVPTNLLGPHGSSREIGSILVNNGMGSDINTRKKEN